MREPLETENATLFIQPGTPILTKSAHPRAAEPLGYEKIDAVNDRYSDYSEPLSEGWYAKNSESISSTTNALANKPTSSKIDYISDEIRALELEAASLKVRREQLALNREINNHRRIEKAAQIGIDIAKTAKSAGNVVWEILKFLLIFVAGSIVGILVLCAYNIFRAYKNMPRLEGDFEYRFGFLMGSLPNWAYAIAIIGGGFWLVIKFYSRK